MRKERDGLADKLRLNKNELSTAKQQNEQLQKELNALKKKLLDAQPVEDTTTIKGLKAAAKEQKLQAELDVKDLQRQANDMTAGHHVELSRKSIFLADAAINRSEDYSNLIVESLGLAIDPMEPLGQSLDGTALGDDTFRDARRRRRQRLYHDFGINAVGDEVEGSASRQ